jgi:hypothetical protein
MKYAAIVVMTIFFFSCNEIGSVNFKKQPADTVMTTILYAHNFMYNDYRAATVQKIIMDTFAEVSIDSFITKKEWTRDSVYYIQLSDTAKVNGMPVRDSVGKIKMEPRLYVVPKDIILEDFNKEWPNPKLK